MLPPRVIIGVHATASDFNEYALSTEATSSIDKDADCIKQTGGTKALLLTGLGALAGFAAGVAFSKVITGFLQIRRPSERTSAADPRWNPSGRAHVGREA